MITKEMGITDIVTNYPESFSVFQTYGMGCVGCMAARFESLEQGASAHGIDADELVADLNAAVLAAKA